jgi:hypothetical protein
MNSSKIQPTKDEGRRTKDKLKSPGENSRDPITDFVLVVLFSGLFNVVASRRNSPRIVKDK